MNKKPYQKIMTLMHNIKTLNEGKEIGGWLTGNIELKEKTIIVTLEEFIIPKQTVTGTEVDISPESMIDTIKTIGIENSNKIKAHWHIHPFGKGKTNWSSTDEEKIKNFTQPEKEREIFIFLLSSEDWMKARIEINAKITLLGQTYTYHVSEDDLEVSVEEPETNTILEELQREIKEKVEVKTYKSEYKEWKNWRDNTYSKTYNTTKKALKKDNKLYIVNQQKNAIHIKINATYYNYLDGYGEIEDLKTHAQTITEINDIVSIKMWAKDKNDAKEACRIITEKFRKCEDDYRDIMRESTEEDIIEDYMRNQKGYSVRDGIIYYD